MNIFPNLRCCTFRALCFCVCVCVCVFECARARAMTQIQIRGHYFSAVYSRPQRLTLADQSSLGKREIWIQSTLVKWIVRSTVVQSNRIRQEQPWAGVLFSVSPFELFGNNALFCEPCSSRRTSCQPITGWGKSLIILSYMWTIFYITFVLRLQFSS